MCVLWWNISDSTAIQEAVFCNFDLTYLLCCVAFYLRIFSAFILVKRALLFEGSWKRHLIEFFKKSFKIDPMLSLLNFRRLIKRADKLYLPGSSSSTCQMYFISAIRVETWTACLFIRLCVLRSCACANALFATHISRQYTNDMVWFLRSYIGITVSKSARGVNLFRW
jgi:hypothetical protein